MGIIFIEDRSTAVIEFQSTIVKILFSSCNIGSNFMDLLNDGFFIDPKFSQIRIMRDPKIYLSIVNELMMAAMYDSMMSHRSNLRF